MRARLPRGREGEHELSDGRRIAFELLGAQDGPLVLVLDGPGSRGLGRAADADARALGVRLLVPDRPGFGGSSSPPAGYAFAATAADLIAVVRALGGDRLGLVAQSGGTPYALAVAAAEGEAITGLAFVGGISPLGEPGALTGVRGPMRALSTLGRRAPWLLRPLFEAVALRTRRDPEAAARAYAKGLPESDRAVLADPDMWALHVITSAEAVSSPAQWAREARMLARPWDVDLARVRAPVAFWAGEEDPVHPPVMSRRLAQRLGGAPVTVVPGAATFGMVRAYPDVLRHAAGLPRPAP